MYFLQKTNLPGRFYTSKRLFLPISFSAPYFSIRNGFFMKVGLCYQSIFTIKIFFMKKLITLVLITVTFYNLQAQKKSAETSKKTFSKIYIVTGVGGAFQKGNNSELGLQAIIKNKWSFSFSKQTLSMSPKNLPANYIPESGIIFFIPFTHEINTNMKHYSITAGKYFSLGRTSWITTEAGISFVRGEKINFTSSSNDNPNYMLPFLYTSYTTSNYNTTREKKNVVGGILRADLNWAFLPFMGMGAGVFVNLNSIQSPMGYQLKFTMGAMGRQRKSNKH